MERIYKFRVRLVGAVSLALPVFFQALGDAAVNNPPLGGGIFSGRVGKFGAVNYEFWGDDNFTALQRELHQIALLQPGLNPQPCGDGYLAFMLDFGNTVHNVVRLMLKSGIPPS